METSERPTYSLADIAERFGGEIVGDATVRITQVATLETANVQHVSFFSNPRYRRSLDQTNAGAVLVSREAADATNRPRIVCDDPYAYFARLSTFLNPTEAVVPGTHPSASVDPTASIDPSCSIGALVAIGPGAIIGARTLIQSGSSVGAKVRIGADCRIYANVSIYHDCVIGERVILHSGAVIGADGFGYVMDRERWHKFPQVGRVEIGDFVEIGANSTVDRAALGVTSIGEGTKLDNMVHVGHNCRIGRHVVVAAQTGFSGGVVVEDYAVIGGQVGIGDKARIESRAILGSGCGVLTSKIVRSGETVWGTPARPLKQHLEQLANLARLPEMRKEMADLKRRLMELERKS